MIVLDINKPDNCKDCLFRLNMSRQSWRCSLRKAYRGGASYISKLYDAENSRPDFCPLDKLEKVVM